MILQQQEKDLIWEAGNTSFKHYFFGYMFTFVETLPEEHQKVLLEAAEMYMKQEGKL